MFCAQCALCMYVGSPPPKAQDVQPKTIAPESQTNEGDIAPPPKTAIVPEAQSKGNVTPPPK